MVKLTKEEYICDDRFSTPEYIQALWNMSESEFEKHIAQISEGESQIGDQYECQLE